MVSFRLIQVSYLKESGNFTLYCIPNTKYSKFKQINDNHKIFDALASNSVARLYVYIALVLPTSLPVCIDNIQYSDISFLCELMNVVQLK